MTFREIIRENTDRLFIVDTECFIVFTGSSINDERPFIRIGTWYDLPVEIIPLIENVILTDRILGNPAHEQFNIDIKEPVANRYIGGESIIRRFLDYQKNFGLDLTNVSVVNIEKDIPELPKHSNISDRDQFIGVFYSDGNIKIVHDGADILNLNSILSENVSVPSIQEMISQEHRGSDRYSGAGFVIADSNPIFYSGGYFTSYQYPSSPLEVFSRLGIDPARIREVLLPSQNILNLSSLMKFKNSRSGKVRIFSDNPEQFDLIKRLFKNCTLVDERFSSMNLQTGDGLRITAMENSPNIKLGFKLKDSADEFNVPFIKYHHDTKRILRENPDLVLITYTAYEESALLFKSSEVPVIIVDDGNRNISRIGESKPVVRKGMQYEIQKFESEQEIINLLELPAEISAAFSSKDMPAIDAWIESLKSGEDSFMERFNASTMITFYLNTTSDRKFFSALRQIQQKYFIKTDSRIPDDAVSGYKTILAMHKKLCYQIISRVKPQAGSNFTDVYSAGALNRAGLSSEQKKTGERILADRERLWKLLAYFYNDRKASGKFEKLENQVMQLKDEIENRKEIYSSDLYLQDAEHITATGRLKSSGRQDKTGIFGSGLLSTHSAAGITGHGTDKTGRAVGSSAGEGAAKASLPQRIACLFTGRAGSPAGTTAGTSAGPGTGQVIDTQESISRQGHAESAGMTIASRIGFFLTGSVPSGAAGAGGKTGAGGRTGAESLRGQKRGRSAGDEPGMPAEKMSFPARLWRYLSGRNSWSGESSCDEKGRSLLTTGQRVRRWIGVTLPLVIIAAAIIFFTYRYMHKGEAVKPADEKIEGATENTGEIITVKRVNEEEKILLQERNVIIRDIDIYNYANEVALKNGFEKLTYSGIKNKNPHWIYPSNIFIMLDGEQVVVQKGDTLWDLARAKLEKMNADFYKIIAELEKTDPSDKAKMNDLISKAEQFAYIPRQKEIIKSYRSKTGNGN